MIKKTLAILMFLSSPVGFTDIKIANASLKYEIQSLIDTCMLIHNSTSVCSFHPLSEIGMPFLKQQDIHTPWTPLQINYILISAYPKYEPVHEIPNNVVCATSKASDQPAHTRSLIRDFACGLSIL